MKKHLISALLAATVVTPFASNVSASGLPSNSPLEFPEVAASEITLRGSIDISAPLSPYMLIGSASINGVPLAPSSFVPPYSGVPMPAPGVSQNVNFQVNVFSGAFNNPEVELVLNGMPSGRDPLVFDAGRFVFDPLRTSSKDVMSSQGYFKFVLELNAVPGQSVPFSLSHNGFSKAPVSNVEYDGNKVIVSAADGRKAELPGISFKNVAPENGESFVRALMEVPATEVNYTRGVGHTSVTLKF
jgi:hypothetical protein